MKIVFNTRQLDVLAEFFANMAIAWFVAAFIAPASLRSLVIYGSYGIVSLYAALLLKGGKS